MELILYTYVFARERERGLKINEQHRLGV